MMSLFGRGGAPKQPQEATQSTRRHQDDNSANSAIIQQQQHQWEVYVDQSKPSLDRGGSATLDAFLGLAPPSLVKVMAATLDGTTTTNVVTTTNSADPSSFSSDKKSVANSATSSSKSASSSNTGSSNNNNKKKKGPLVRCLSTDGTKCMDVSNVDSVDKVYRILTKHMKTSASSSSSSSSSSMISSSGYIRIPYKLAECLKWKYKGNAHLESGKFDEAVHAYNEALGMLQSISSSSTGKQKASATTQKTQTTSTRQHNTQQNDDTYDQIQQQEGILLLMRATAYLQRAASHKTILKSTVKELMSMVPDAAKLKNLYEQTSSIMDTTTTTATAATTTTADPDNKATTKQPQAQQPSSQQQRSCLPPSVRHSVFRRVLADAAQQEESFRKTQYWHGLYQYALLQAAQDVLQSTQLLPTYSRGYARAGEILSELWKLSESLSYYQTAVVLDDRLGPQLQPVMDRLQKRRDLLTSARAYGWSEDTLRLALDVAG